MTTPRLFIANKAYSSWSMRPWLVMRHFGLPFDEEVIPLDTPTTRSAILRHSPTGKLPALAADGLLLWESLGIVEYLADLHPGLGIWPEDRTARAMARTVSAEMHAGFTALRRACPMNLRRPVRAIPVGDDVKADVARVEEVWASMRAGYGGGGDFLFGAFSAADAMFAPVVNRLDTYALATRPETRAYMAAMQALPAWQDWLAGARAEPWFIPHYEAI